VVDQRQQAGCRQHFAAACGASGGGLVVLVVGVDVVKATPRCLAATGGRADHAAAVGGGMYGRGQHAGDAGDRAIERQLAEHDVALQRVGRQHADRRHQRQRDRQVVVAAFLGEVGGREVHRDAPGRQREPQRRQRRAHAFAAFADRLVGQADERKRRHARRDLHLHVDRHHVDALKRHRANPRDHAHLLPWSGNI